MHKKAVIIGFASAAALLVLAAVIIGAVVGTSKAKSTSGSSSSNRFTTVPPVTTTNPAKTTAASSKTPTATQTTTEASSTASPTTLPPTETVTEAPTTAAPSPTATTTAQAPTTTPPSSLAPPPPAPALYYIGLRTLIVSSQSAAQATQYVRDVLYSRGTPYDLVDLSAGNPLQLYGTDGSAKYSSIIVSIGTGAEMTPQIRSTLTDYEERFGVPEVEMNANPSVETGTTGALATAGVDCMINVAAAGMPFAYGLNTTTYVYLSTAEVRRYLVSITDTTLTVPILYAFDSSESVIATLSTYRAGTSLQHRKMALFFDGESQTSESFAHWWASYVWFHFLTCGIYVGNAEMMYLQAHVDDVLLADDVYNPVQHVTETSPSFRISTTDWSKWVSWSHDVLPALLPTGSEMVVEMWLNCAAAFGDPSIAFAAYDSGELFAALNSSWEVTLWGSHSWSHQNEDTFTASQALAELDTNHKFIREKFTAMNTGRLARFEQDTIVMPQISGLLNSAVLKTLLELGIWSTVGDLTRPEITNPDRYHGQWTSWYTHPTLGQVLVVPRSPTNLYYYCYNDTCTKEAYWDLHGRTINPSFAQIMQWDADMVLYCIARLDSRTWMFHQPNLHQFTYGSANTSLLAIWMETVISRFTTYFTYPLNNFGLSHIAKEYKSREKRDACSYDAQIVMRNSTNTVQSITLSNHCTEAVRLSVPLSLISPPFFNGRAYGPQYTIEIAPSSTTEVPIVYNMRG